MNKSDINDAIDTLLIESPGAIKPLLDRAVRKLVVANTLNIEDDVMDPGDAAAGVSTQLGLVSPAILKAAIDAVATASNVKALYEANADTHAFTTALMNKLSGLSQGYKGWYVDQAALETAHPSPAVGDFAHVGASYREYIESSGDWLNNSLDEGPTTGQSGTALSLSNPSGSNYNFDAASGALSYTLANIVAGGKARSLINANAEPTVSGSVKISPSAPFSANQQMILEVEVFESGAVYHRFLSIENISANAGPFGVAERSVEFSENNAEFVQMDSPLSLPGDFTVEAWLKFKDTAVNQNDMIFGNAADNTRVNFYSEKLRLAMQGNNDVIKSSIAIQDTNWHHFCIVRESGALKLYVDGIEDTAVEGSALTGFTETLVISHWGSLPVASFSTNGYLDVLRVFNLARSAAEVTANYNKDIPVNTPGLIMYLHFNEAVDNSSLAVLDLSGNGNSATLGSNASVATDAPVRSNIAAPLI